MAATKKTNKRDLSKDAGSLANALEPIIPMADKLSFSELKQKLTDTLNSESLKASQATRSKWLSRLTKINRDSQKVELMMLITNIYLAGSALSTKID